MTASSPDRSREWQLNAQALIDAQDLIYAFDVYPDAVLRLPGDSERRIMARGDAGSHVAKFLVTYATFEIAGNPNKSLTIDPIEQGAIDYSRVADFSTLAARGRGRFSVRNIDPRRPDRSAAIKSAKLLLPAALEAEPLAVDRDIAQLVIDPRSLTSR
jgi:hypothetical protein